MSEKWRPISQIVNSFKERFRGNSPNEILQNTPPEALMEAISLTSHPWYIVGPTGKVKWMNDGGYKLFGLEPKESKKVPEINGLDHVDLRSLGLAKELFSKLLSQGPKNLLPIQVTINTLSGSHDIRIDAVVLCPEGYLINVTDITESIRDGLCENLFSRKATLDYLQLKVAEAMRKGNSLNVIAIDIDHFKMVNDTIGHSGGDYVLKFIANLLPEPLRQSDIVGRWGGEEFMAIIPQSSKKQAVKIAERIRETVSKKTIVYDEISIEPKISLGVSSFPFSSEELEILPQYVFSIVENDEKSKNYQNYPIINIILDLLSGEKLSVISEKYFQQKVINKEFETYLTKIIAGVLCKTADHALYYSKNNGRDQVNAFSDLIDQVTQ